MSAAFVAASTLLRGGSSPLVALRRSLLPSRLPSRSLSHLVPSAPLRVGRLPASSPLLPQFLASAPIGLSRCFASESGGDSPFRRRPKPQAVQAPRVAPKAAVREEEVREQEPVEDRVSRARTASAAAGQEEQNRAQMADGGASQLEALSPGAVAYLRQCWGLMGASFAMAGAASGVSALAMPMMPAIAPLGFALASFVPMFMLFRSDPAKDSETKRAALLGSFAVLTGAASGPLIWVTMHMNPLVVPAALGATGLMFGGMTLASLYARQGSALKLGVPLAGGMIGIMGISIANIWVQSPMLSNVWVYGGLLLFTGYVAYDTHATIQDYNEGERDPYKHALSFFQNAWGIFRHLLVIFGVGPRND